jgi:aminocarboxymuconate-semialdehyde decarboxylase
VVVCTTGVLSGLLDQMAGTAGIDEAFAYNEEIAKAQREHPGAFVGTAMVPLQDTGSALEVLEHAIGELDLRAVNLAPTTGAETTDLPRLEPFYARVAELGVPLIVHPTDLAFGPVLDGYEQGIQRSIGRLLDSSVTVLRLIFSGIMARNPGLTVVQTHGGGLLPYQAGRIDKNARIKGLPQLPSHYLRQVYTDVVAPQASTLRFAAEWFGLDHLMYGTDYPCWNQAAALDVLAEAFPEESARSAVLHTNPAAVFNLD